MPWVSLFLLRNKIKKDLLTAQQAPSVMRTGTSHTLNDMGIVSCSRFTCKTLQRKSRTFFMARTKEHNTFLVHMNHEEMFTTVSPEQCQRLVKAMFLLARTGELADFSDDIVLGIFFKQISSFMLSNKEHYDDVCAKRKEVASARWEEYRKLKAEEARRKGEPAEHLEKEPPAGFNNPFNITL